MAQYQAWENEYRRLSLLTAKPEPQKDVIRFLKFLKKVRKVSLDNLQILDLGSGTGRNTNYLQSLGNHCTGMEISCTAIEIAKSRAKKELLQTQFIKQSIGENFPFPNQTFDLALDIISSNSLDEGELHLCLKEVNRVIKKGGYFMVKALCKEGDKNAQNLLKSSPGPEKNTYLMKELNLVERVFSREELLTTYDDFEILKLIKKTSYTQMNGRSYRRNFWILYLQKTS